ncbi:MAG TPA: serine protease [Ktedonobacteraceae bacterium]|nr:serine protease [Ktedonobacteraceae bacterium]
MDRWIKTQVRVKLLAMLCMVSVIALMSLMIGGGVASAHTYDIPGGNVADPVVRAVDIAQPAVVRIITQVNGKLIVHFASGDVTFPRDGSNGYPLTLSGTGTFISAHGDILTADHVVNPPQADLDSFLQQTAAQDVANYMNQIQKVNPQVSAAQVANALASGQLNSTSQYATPLSRAYLSIAFTGPLSATSFQDIPANVFSNVDRIEAQSAVNQKDVAIIHVSNMDDKPMVQLGDSSGVQVQDQLTIIGFPGNGDVSTTPTNLLTSSVNTVNVSSIKTTDTGAPLIQVGGNVEHGDSGGPALDSTGKVVGIVSFGIGTQGITSFLQASNSAQQLVQQLNLNTAPGAFQKSWSQAFNDYSVTDAGHWHKAAQELQQLATAYPQFKGISPYLAYAQQQAKTEKVAATPTATPTPATSVSSASSFLSANWLLLAGVVIVVLGILLFGVVITRRRGKKPAQAAGKQSYGAPANGAYPYTPPVNQGPSPVPPQPQTPQAYQQQRNPSNPSMPFGAPPALQAPPVWPAPPQSSQPPASRPPGTYASGTSNAEGDRTQIMVAWPCGHMNLSTARFCSKCGEPARPNPPVRRYEQ